MGRKAPRKSARKPARNGPNGSSNTAAAAQQAANAPSTDPETVRRYLRAAVGAALNKTAVQSDGLVAKRDIDTAGLGLKSKRAAKPARVDEALGDLKSHIEGRVPPQGFAIHTTLEENDARVALSVHLDKVNQTLARQHFAAASATAAANKHSPLPDGIADDSPLAKLYRALPAQYQAEPGAFNVFYQCRIGVDQDPVYVPAADLEQYLDQRLRVNVDLTPEVQYNLHTRHWSEAIERMRQCIRCVVDAPVEVRRPDVYIKNYTQPALLDLEYDPTQSEVRVNIAAVQDVRQAAHAFSHVDYKSAWDLAPPLPEAIDHVMEVAQQSAQPDSRAVVGNLAAVDPAAAELDDLESRLGIKDHTTFPNSNRQLDAHQRCLHLMRAYAHVLRRIHVIEKSLEPLAQMAQDMHRLPEPDSELASQPDETSALLTDADQDSLEKGQGITAETETTLRHCRALHDGLTRNTHVIAHVKQALSQQLQMCDSALSTLNDFHKRLSANIENRRAQRLEVENKIWRAGDRANKKSVEKARAQIADMEAEEARQISELSDHADYTTHLNEAKRWLVYDLTTVGPLEKYYDQKNIPELQAYVKPTASRISGSLTAPARPYGTVPSIEVIKGCESNLHKFADFLHQLRERFQRRLTEFYDVKAQYLAELRKLLPTANPLQQAVCATLVEAVGAQCQRLVEADRLAEQARQREQEAKMQSYLDSLEKQAAQQKRQRAEKRSKQHATDRPSNSKDDVSTASSGPTLDGHLSDAPSSKNASVTGAPASTDAAASQGATPIGGTHNANANVAKPVVNDTGAVIALATDASVGSWDAAADEDWLEAPQVRRKKGKSPAGAPSSGDTAGRSTRRGHNKNAGAMAARGASGGSTPPDATAATQPPRGNHQRGGRSQKQGTHAMGSKASRSARAEAEAEAVEPASEPAPTPAEARQVAASMGTPTYSTAPTAAVATQQNVSVTPELNIPSPAVKVTSILAEHAEPGITLPPALSFGRPDEAESSSEPLPLEKKPAAATVATDNDENVPAVVFRQGDAGNSTVSQVFVFAGTAGTADSPGATPEPAAAEPISTAQEHGETATPAAVAVQMPPPGLSPKREAHEPSNESSLSDDEANSEAAASEHAEVSTESSALAEADKLSPVTTDAPPAYEENPTGATTSAAYANVNIDAPAFLPSFAPHMAMAYMPYFDPNMPHHMMGDGAMHPPGFDQMALMNSFSSDMMMPGAGVMGMHAMMSQGFVPMASGYPMPFMPGQYMAPLFPGMAGMPPVDARRPDQHNGHRRQGNGRSRNSGERPRGHGYGRGKGASRGHHKANQHQAQHGGAAQAGPNAPASPADAHAPGVEADVAPSRVPHL